MSPPNWQTGIAMDGETRVSLLHHEDGSVSIRIVAGAISIVAAVSAEQAAFLAQCPTPGSPEVEAAA